MCNKCAQVYIPQVSVLGNGGSMQKVALWNGMLRKVKAAGYRAAQQATVAVVRATR